MSRLRNERLVSSGEADLAIALLVGWIDISAGMAGLPRAPSSPPGTTRERDARATAGLTVSTRYCLLQTILP